MWRHSCGAQDVPIGELLSGLTAGVLSLGSVRHGRARSSCRIRAACATCDEDLAVLCSRGRVARRDSWCYHPGGWSRDGRRMVGVAGTEAEKTEKITINLGLV